MTILLEDILYDLPNEQVKTLRIDKKMVDDKLQEIISDEDLSQYIL